MDEAKVRLIAKELQVQRSDATNTVFFHGHSMRPFFKEGDELIIAPVAWENIQFGDIITYRFEDKFPTRRVVKIRDGTLELWCEGWPYRHYQALRADVLGQAVARKQNQSWLYAHQFQWQAATFRALTIFAALKILDSLKSAGPRFTIRKAFEKIRYERRQVHLKQAKRPIAKV